MKREKLAVSPWDSRSLMVLLQREIQPSFASSGRKTQQLNLSQNCSPRNGQLPSTCRIFSVCCCGSRPRGVWCCVLAEQGCRGPRGRARLTVLPPHLQHTNTLFPPGRGHAQCHTRSREKATPQHKHRTSKGCRTEHGHAIGHHCASHVLPGPLGSELGGQILLNLLVPQGAEHLPFPRCLAGGRCDQPTPLVSNGKGQWGDLIGAVLAAG